MDKRCKLAQCERKSRARGWCIFHYNRWKIYGDPEPSLKRVIGDDLARFLSKVNKTETCWLWTGGSFTEQGYPQFSVNRKNKMAYRWSHEYFIGPIPDGNQVDHLCRNILCVRPEHLEAVTQEENRRRQSEAAGAIGRKCEVPGCDRPYKTTGTCVMHRARRHRALPIGG
jgi:hypothetical protein